MTICVRIPTIIGCSKQPVTSHILFFVKNRDLRLNLVLKIFQKERAPDRNPAPS